MNSFRLPALRSTARAAQTTCSKVAPRRGYATDHSQMDTANKPSRLPILFGGAALLIGGGLYTIQSGQANVAHNDHAAQKGGASSRGRQSTGSMGGIDQSKSDLPADAPNHPDNLAASQQKMQNKTPTKRVDPLK